ncbi:MAG: 60S ribosomal protein L15 [Watsoniomyces obsoletus]|nr:MAG: 60S ribosomal protein L15 [Watsoniomyces obsoletus]
MASSPSQPMRLPRPTNGVRRHDKGTIAGRRLTPDSEALASSDDELDKRSRDGTAVGPPGARTTPRRPSWLGDVQNTTARPVRKSSIAGAGSVSPRSSQPNSPSVEPPIWGTVPSPGLTRGQPVAPGTGSSFLWSSNIWNGTDTRKDPPSRLAEVMPSPMSERGSVDYDVAPGDSTIPFAIPLHPTPKSYRSQSYSVGQLDLDLHPRPGPLPGRVKPSQPPGLQHRPSRPSLLGDLSRDGSALDRVHEAENDEEVDEEDAEAMSNGANHRARHASDAVLNAPMRENLLRRQMAVTTQAENMRWPGRGGSTTVATAPTARRMPSGMAHRIQGSVPEESDYAVDEADEVDDLHSLSPNLTGRRFSEFGTNTADSRFAALVYPEHRKIESLKKGYWQSSLGFGGLTDIPQSRRHSFAEVPARNGSVTSSAAESSVVAANSDVNAARVRAEQQLSRFPEPSTAGRNMQPNQEWTAGVRSPYSLPGPVSKMPTAESARYPNGPASYFGALTAAPRTAFAPVTTSSVGLQPMSVGPSMYAHDRAPSPLGGLPRNAFIAPPHLGMPTRQAQPLCIVTFKCCRADVFYLPEGTGLHVKVGDMVIVEADRGTDLGTVVSANISWEQARELKEQYAEEHYKCLMMFSRHVAQGGHLNGLRSGPGGGSAVGGMGPPGGHGGAEASASELRPKMIKRLAQTHEVQTLRDKEGNEAKAKRVCQQKVAEHHLQMEILDAEFQMDWKKLTFYYFADAYINFNSLVTELFKVYKTRIWMSAINPASFAHLSTGAVHQSGILSAPGTFGIGRQSPYRPGHDMFYSAAPATAGLGHAAPPVNGFQPAYAPSTETSPVGDVAPTSILASPYAYTFQPFGPIPRGPGPSVNGHDYNVPRTADRPVEFRPIKFGDFRPEPTRRPGEPDPAGRRDAHLGQAAQPGWVTGFQGLSLGSH